MDDRALLQTGFRYAMSLCGNPADAEDLVHEAWIRCRTKLSDDVPKRYFLRVIRNHFIDLRRREQVVRFEAEDKAPEQHDELDLMEASIIRHDLKGPMKSLSPKEREALYLNVVEGYTALEIALMTGSKRGTVLSHLHRARNKLKSALALEDDAAPDDNTAQQQGDGQAKQAETLMAVAGETAQ
ncbi:MAG: RNA polymerase sigma factor SigR [Alphaproteobacteria bacterium]